MTQEERIQFDLLIDRVAEVSVLVEALVTALETAGDMYSCEVFRETKESIRRNKVLSMHDLENE